MAGLHPIYNNNAFEMFINPDERQPGCLEYEINALGTLWDLRLGRGRYRRQTDASGKPLPAGYGVWNPQSAVDMHRPWHWGFVTFAR